MPVITETAAPRRVRLEALARNGGVRRRADRDGSGGKRLRRRAGRADAPRDRDEVQGSGSITSWFAAAPACAHRPRVAGLRSASRSTYAVGVPVFAHPGGIFPRIALVPGETEHERSERASAYRKWPSRSRGWRTFSRAHDLGLEIARLSDGPLPGRPRCRASGRRWPWSSGAAIWASSRFPASWPARGG